jgi:lysophospholipase L1-like esterase
MSPLKTLVCANAPHRRLTPLLALAALLAAAAPALRAQELSEFMPTAEAPVASPAHVRWQSSLDAFASADQAQRPASGGVLFVGSSTIRLWPHLAQDFSAQPVLLQRGFGGSTLADCSALTHELVTQYKPRQVLIYAGDNDLAEGRPPADLLASFARFVQRVRAELPGTRIDYIAIKPSPSRLTLLPKIREANALIASHAKTLKDVGYIDIFSPMLTAEGQPRPELFLTDRLHLNAAGYQLWQSVIAAHLLTPPLPSPAGPAPGHETAPAPAPAAPLHTAR